MHVSATYPLEAVARELLKLAPGERPRKRINYASLQFEGILASSDEEELFAVALSPSGGIAAGSESIADRVAPHRQIHPIRTIGTDASG